MVQQGKCIATSAVTCVATLGATRGQAWGLETNYRVLIYLQEVAVLLLHIGLGKCQDEKEKHWRLRKVTG